jgi:hypothetical protein
MKAHDFGRVIASGSLRADRRIAMGECAAQVFSNFSQDRFARLTARAAAEGFSIEGVAGTFTQTGVTVTWAYDAASQSLTIQCIKAPFLLGCGSINSSIHNLIDSCP